MGKVYLVGAGPGAPDLLTLRAARVLGCADIVFHDALVHPDVVALASRARIVAVGKRCSQISTDQRFINRALVEAAHRHDTVVRLKGGDPMIFGRAQEEIEALRAGGVEFEVVPGVTAALGASAELGLSLTQRGVSRSVLLATSRAGADQQPGEWARAVASADTAVLYMGSGEADVLTASLLAAGLAHDAPAAIVARASLPDRQVLHATLATLGEQAAKVEQGPALVIVGEALRASTSACAQAGGAIPVSATLGLR
ncbi:MAG TPA: uroporphyrinogen-III C-methyltransferase [Burkholderiales bacterium]|nr:uroporphyrinogen-III C-methyltransferase [Burkholderiales bacterium]